MKTHEAQFILSAYRPSGQDVADPHFREALEHAQRDPATQQWFAQELTWDRAIAAKLQSISAPPTLRAHILAGAIVIPQRKLRQLPVLVAAAALAIALGIAALFFARSGRAPLADWQLQTIASLENIHDLDVRSTNPGELTQWLHESDAPVPETLPPGLRALSALGCKILNVGGQRISIICFQREGGDLVHLITAAHKTTRRAALDRRPVFTKRDGWTIASWSDNENAYMLATKGGKDQLQTLL